MHKAISDLVEAALDQRKPSAELRQALNAYLEASQHRLSESYRRRFSDRSRLPFGAACGRIGGHLGPSCGCLTGKLDFPDLAA